jgi:hypothetical protein
MELVVKYTGRFRPIVPVPWFVGELQGEILQRLPTNMFTVTRDQVRFDSEVLAEEWLLSFNSTG